VGEMEMMEDPQMTTTMVEGDVVEIIADYGLGALGVIRLLFTFVYCALLSILPLIAGTTPPPRWTPSLPSSSSSFGFIYSYYF
jgi:hypothetical protein